MSDKEIIKALECCSEHHNTCRKNCPLDSTCDTVRDCLFKLSRITLDLINRQKAEIERLEKELMKCKLEKEMLYNVGMEIKTVAIKEFAERLKENITSAIDTYYNSNGGGYYLAEDTIEDIDNLVEEMTEEKE